MPSPDRGGGRHGAGGPGPAGGGRRSAPGVCGHFPGGPAGKGGSPGFCRPGRGVGRRLWRRGRPAVSLPTYFGHRLQVFKDELRYPPGVPTDPWDAILLYNYIASQAQEPVAGRWIAYNSLPNSVSKAKTLTRLEKKLAEHFAGQAARLKQRVDELGGEMVAVGGEDADLQAAFLPLPKVPLLLLFWDAEAEEGFAPQAHLLFDASVTHYLDLEAMLFLVEHLMERLMAN